MKYVFHITATFVVGFPALVVGYAFASDKGWLGNRGFPAR